MYGRVTGEGLRDITPSGVPQPRRNPNVTCAHAVAWLLIEHPPTHVQHQGGPAVGGGSDPLKTRLHVASQSLKHGLPKGKPNLAQERTRIVVGKPCGIHNRSRRRASVSLKSRFRKA